MKSDRKTKNASGTEVDKLVNSGITLTHEGECEEAYEQYRKALDILARKDDTHAAAGLMMLLATHSDRFYEGNDTPEYASSAIELFRKLYGYESPKVAMCVEHIGYYHLDRSQYAVAAECFETAMKVYNSRNGDDKKSAADAKKVSLDLAQCYYLMSDRAMQRDEHIAAYQFLVSAATIIFASPKGENTIDGTMLLFRFAMWHDWMDNFDESIFFAERSLAAFKKLPKKNDYWLAKIQIFAAWACFENGQAKKHMFYINKFMKTVNKLEVSRREKLAEDIQWAETRLAKAAEKKTGK